MHPVWAQEHCRISPPCFLAECHKRQLNRAGFVLLCFALFAFFGLCLVCVFSVIFNLSSVLYFQHDPTWMTLYSLIVLMCRWPFDAHCCHMHTAIKHPVPDRVKPSFVIFDIRTLWRSALSVLSPERQSVWMSKITSDGLTRSGTKCFVAIPIWQQWASKVYSITDLVMSNGVS